MSWQRKQERRLFQRVCSEHEFVFTLATHWVASVSVYEIVYEAVRLQYVHEMQKNIFYLCIAILISFLLNGCAVLHHIQVGEVDGRTTYAMVPFEIMISETGISTQEIGQIAKATKSDAGSDIAEIVGLFQMGPRTGNPIYNPAYAEKLVYEIHQKCPSGQVTNLMSIRETRKYPVISGEIVKITGVCRKAKNV